MKNKEDYLINRMLRRYRTNDTQMELKEEELHKEGDEWDENGKRWKVVDGSVRCVSKSTRVFTPLFCPKCKSSMNDNNDDTMYKLYGHCFNCQVEYETQLKIDGQYSHWESIQINKNIDAIKNDLLGEYQEFKASSLQDKNIYNEDGIKVDTIYSTVDENLSDKLIDEKIAKLDKLKI